jgi:hypothetical protein
MALVGLAALMWGRADDDARCGPRLRQSWTTGVSGLPRYSVPRPLCVLLHSGPALLQSGQTPDDAHGLKDATTCAMIRHLWACAPDANVGIACSGDCVVLDVDPRHGGNATLDQLARRHGAVPVTWTAKTGGGWHYFFRCKQEVRNSAGKIGDGIDVRGNGGYVVAPPSLHVSGNRYSWAPGLAPADVPLAAMPEWLVMWRAPAAMVEAGLALKRGRGAK